jgi:uncharacterized protein (TIGR02217 family)
MSNVVFPSFAGLAWPVKRTPIFNTKIQKAVSARETRIAFMAYPIYKIELTFDYLSLQDWATFGGFFKTRRGKWDSFLFNDVRDNSVTAQGFGTGTGAATQFQLTRALGGYTEPVENLNGTPSIYINGVLQSGTYSINSTGLVTFNSAPANGAALTWTGSFYWRVRFDQDEAEFSENLSMFFDLKKLTLYGATGNKV